MLKANRHGRRRGRRRPDVYADDPTLHPGILGCTVCPNYELCGGLHTRSGAFDCMSYCCNDPTACDVVCPRDVSRFVDRSREVGGFSLESLPSASVQPPVGFPSVVPLVYHGSGREKPFTPPGVVLPLHAIYDRHTGHVRWADRSGLCERFKIGTKTQIILSGTEKDQPIERWWGLGPQRRATLEALGRLGVSAVTTPNYSVFSDVPRWDNFHSMKRIAISFREIADAGITAGLHPNARTVQDWRRWRDFVGERPEVALLSYEFATGAGDSDRMEWHADQLCGLAGEVARPLAIIVRGGRRVLPQLRASFGSVCFVDSTSFMKSISRQRAFLRAGGSVGWGSVAGSARWTLSQLLEHNHSIVTEYVTGLGRVA